MLDYFINLTFVQGKALWGKLKEFAVSRPRFMFLAVIIGLVAFAIFLRLAHLLSSDHYFILSFDSYFFHWLAERVMNGEGPPADSPVGPLYTMRTGLAYPIAYIAKAASSVFDLSPSDAIDLTCKLLPPLIAVISIVVVYIIGSRMFNRKVGILAALAWVALPHAMIVGAAGYIDRDVINMLLVMLGASIFYLSKDWTLRLANRNVNWLVAVVAVLAIEALLFLEWSPVGSGILFCIVAFYCLLKTGVEYFDHLESEPSLLPRLSRAIASVDWRPFLLLIVANVAAWWLGTIFYTDVAADFVGWLKTLLQTPGRANVGELQPLGIGDILTFQFFIITIALGFYVSWKKRSEAGVFLCSWLIITLIISVFVRRVLFFTVPPACLLSGIAIVYIWEWGKSGRFALLKRAVTVAVIFLQLLLAVAIGLLLGGPATFSVKGDWYDALSYLREETPKGAIVMTQWSYGYWILDLGQRRPLVDNGYYGNSNNDILHDIGVAYSTSDPSEAVEIMRKYEASYLVFGRDDLSIAPAILGWAGLSEEYDSFPANSLFTRSLAGDFTAEEGLEVVYSNRKVVILRSLPDT